MTITEENYHAHRVGWEAYIVKYTGMDSGDRIFHSGIDTFSFLANCEWMIPCATTIEHVYEYTEMYKEDARTYLNIPTFNFKAVEPFIVSGTHVYVKNRKTPILATPKINLRRSDVSNTCTLNIGLVPIPDAIGIEWFEEENECDLCGMYLIEDEQSYEKFCPECENQIVDIYEKMYRMR